MVVENQDFMTIQGDTVRPIFTVVGADGVTPVDISTVTQIYWAVARNRHDPPEFFKLKTLGQIIFTTDGTNGQFQVLLTAADTTPLQGWFMHFAAITDSAGNIVTTTIGRMNVGLSPSWTWDPGRVGIDSLYTVRQILGDTQQSRQLQSDEQIRWAIGAYSNEWLAAAECARNLAIQFATMVDIGEGPMKKNYSQQSKMFATLARDLEQRGFARGGVDAYVGGISASDKSTQVANTDRVPPNFVIAMHDNLLPEGPVGLQTNSNLRLPVDFGGSGTIPPTP